LPHRPRIESSAEAIDFRPPSGHISWLLCRCFQARSSLFLASTPFTIALRPILSPLLRVSFPPLPHLAPPIVSSVSSHLASYSLPSRLPSP
ncbi:hypothetical protein K523DRAFT_406172, partial [Schizophyllum commune Tattone D]